MSVSYCAVCRKPVDNLNLHNRDLHLSSPNVLVKWGTVASKATKPKPARAHHGAAHPPPPSSTFDTWRVNNPSLSTIPLPISTDDIVNARHSRTDTPGTAAGTLSDAMKYKVQQLVFGFQGLSDADRGRCDALLRSTPIFPSLVAYTFTHLKCCTDDSSLLDPLTTSVAEWHEEGGLWCLLNHKEVKTTLLGLLEQSVIEQHVCNLSLMENSGGAAIDIAHVGALVAEVATHAENARHMFALSGEPAQAMVDLLQALTDAHVPELDEWYRRRFLDALIRLSRKSALYPGSLVLHDVTILSDDPLYSGSFGAVYKAKIQDRLVAVKKLKAGDKELAEILKEFAHEAIVWRHLRHPNCLPFYGVYRADGDSCMISPWMENASLTIYLRKNPGADRSFLILDVARGLEYLHTSQPTVVHGDLKGANILITASGRACLADFGLATTSISQAILPSSTQLRSKGTLNYCGPELLGADPDTIRALDQRRCDMYSFGCICYEIYTGNYPFYGMADVYQQKLLGRTPARPTGPEYDARGLDDDMWGFVVNLWSRNPEARATAEQAVRWLEAEGRSGGRQEVFGEDGAWDVRFLAGLTSPTVGYPFAPAV